MEHIAILRQPFFDMVLNGEKTIESRWSKNKIAPYNKVTKGDVLLLKETSKDVTATALVKDVMFYELTPQIADNIKLQYGNEIGIDKFDDWGKYRNKRYLTLIWLENVHRIKPRKVKSSNGSGWIILK